MLEARDVSARRGGREVLRGVSLRLGPGVPLAVLGPNGAGKTTLLRVLAGLEPPASGQVLLDGRGLAGRDRRGLARSIAYAPQRVEDRFGFSVREAVLLGRTAWLPRLGPADADQRARADRAIEALDLAALADRPVTRLSGGEQRRVALARTLAQDGRVFLLDEPASGLDIRHALGAMRVFADRARDARAALAVVLHDLNLAAMFCPVTLLLDRGGVAAYGPTPRVLTPENIRRVFGVGAQVHDGWVRFLEE
uniref:ABC transporter ATP-binding protein n=1 Tax=Fundidesulfovibrio putealis TaxID=270496 RepID=A0A7C3WCZ7_9BACT